MLRTDDKRAADVGIIIPSRNEGENIGQTVEAVIETTKDLTVDLVIVDDASDDGSCDQLDTKFPGVHVRRNNRNEGVGKSRNIGFKTLEAAEHVAPRVIFIDAHMGLENGWAHELMNQLDRDGVGIAAPTVIAHDNDDNFGCGVTFERPAVPPFGIKWFHSVRPGDDLPMISGMCQAFRTDVFTDIGMFVSNVGGWGAEDLEICIRAWTYGYRVVAAPAARVHHRFRDGFADDFDERVPLINDLRAVLMNFNMGRVGKVLDVMRWNDDADYILAKAGGGDTFRLREKNLTDRQSSDDYFFERFPGDPFDG